MTPPAALRPPLRPLSVAFGALVLVLAAATPAAAHAVLQATSPVDGETLATAPEAVTLQFNEPVTTTLGAVRVYDADGEQLPTGAVETVDGDPARLRVALPPDVPDGTYIATWAVTSADSHPVRGAFVFGVGEALTPDDGVIASIFAEVSRDDPVLVIAASVLRALTYAGALLAVGGVIFLLWVHDRDEAEYRSLSRWALRGVGVAAASSLVGLGVQGALLGGRGPAGVVEPAVLGEVLGTSYGLSALVRLAGLAVLVVALTRLRDRPAALGAATGAAAVVGSFALTGHAATSDPRWLVVSADLAHTLAGATWFGGLVLLAVALRRRRAIDDPVGGGRLVARFSTLATAAVVLVAVAGSGLAWAQVRTARALTDNVYGWTLIAKVAAVLAVLAVGAYNNRRLVPAINRGTNKAWHILRRTVRYEVIGLLAVLALTGVLVNLRPAAVVAGVTGAFATEVPLGEDYTVSVTVDPNRAGTNEIHLYLLGADGRPADIAREVTLALSLPAEDIGPIDRVPVVAGPGHWQLNGSELSIPGEWIIAVTARVSDFEQLRTEVPVVVNP